MLGIYFTSVTALILLVLFYFSIVTFTYIRALDFNLELTGVSAFILPIILLRVHFRLYRDFRLVDKKKANLSLKVLFLKYPVVLTIVLTMIVNRMAEKITTQEVEYKKVSSAKNNVMNRSRLRKSISNLFNTDLYGNAMKEMAV